MYLDTRWAQEAKAQWHSLIPAPDEGISQEVEKI